MTTLPKSFLTKPLAHRGFHDVASGRPENSIAAFQSAIENGFGIELDIQASADGQAMVFHDYVLDRLTLETGAVNERPAADLSNLAILGSDEKILTLEHVLNFVDGRTPLLIEIKDQDGLLGPNVGVLEKAVAKTVENYQGPVAIMSFNPHSVLALAKLAPMTPRGLTTCAFDVGNVASLPETTRIALRNIVDLQRTGACFISHHVADLARPLVQKIRASGMPVLCWTATSQEIEDTARTLADNIAFERYQANTTPA